MRGVACRTMMIYDDTVDLPNTGSNCLSVRSVSSELRRLVAHEGCMQLIIVSYILCCVAFLGSTQASS
jgi:hypothetical protein